MIRFKIDIIQALKDKGYNTTKLREDNIISQSTLTNIRRNYDGLEPLKINAKILDTICSILKKQPGTLLEWTPDPSPDQEQTNE